MGDIMNSEEFCSIILTRINDLMEKKKVRQTELANVMNISQSTLSKMLKGELRLTVEYLYKFCAALDVPVDFLLSHDYKETSSPSEWTSQPREVGLFNDCYINEQIMIRDVGHPAFSGYCGYTFHIYLFPTITTESFLLDGTLTFQKAQGANFCKAEMVLNTGRLTANNEPIQKHYSGELIISLSMGACYCVMIGQEIGEVIYLNFRHMYLFNRHLECRVGILSSSSSGGNRLPITQRILISHHKLLENPIEETPESIFIRGQLRLNNSKMLMAESDLDQLIDDYKDQPEMQNFFQKYKEKSESEIYYNLDESILRDIPVPSAIKTEGLSILRNQSSSKRYNKVSTKTDEFVFEYISNKFGIE